MATRSGKRLLWVWGGALLIAGTVVPLALQYLGGFAGTATAGMVLTGAGWVLFAVGRDRVVVTVAGIVGLFVLASWPLVGALVWPALLSGASGPDDLPGGVGVVGQIDLLIPTAAALVAAVDVWRGDRVPARFRRVPLIAVAVCVVPYVFASVAGVAAPHEQDLLLAAFGFTTLCRVAALVGLGVVAIVAGLDVRRSPDSAVRVYPPST